MSEKRSSRCLACLSAEQRSFTAIEMLKGFRHSFEYLHCQKCNSGKLIPLSDYGPDGASEIFKAWVCTNPTCGLYFRIDKGQVSYGIGMERRH